MDIPDLNILFDAGSPYFTHLSAAIIIVTLFLLFLALLSIAGYFPVLLSITSYTPVVARLKAKGVPYIEQEPVQDLIQSSSVQDCLGKLKATGYLTRGSADITSEQAEEELLLTWFEEVALLRSQAPSESWLFFDAVLFFQEISKVKRIIRLIHMNQADVIADRPGLWPTGCSPDLAAKLGNVRTMSEAVRLLQETRYGEALLDGLALYEKEKSVFFLDHALDCMGFSELKSQTSMVQDLLASPYRDYLAVLTDIQNIRVLIRAKHSGWSPEAVPLCFVDGGRELPLWRLVQLNEMMSLPDLVRQLAGTGYDPVLTPFIRTYPSADTMMNMDLALDQYLLDTVSGLGLVYYHNGGPLLWYLVAKDFELRNIRIILSGIYDGFQVETINRMLITSREET